MGRELTRRQILVAAPVVLTVAACTSTTEQDPPRVTASTPSTSPTPGATGAAAEYRTQRRFGGVHLLPAKDGPATHAVNAALFDEASVVVVADDAHPATLGPAGDVARALAVPLFVGTDGLAAELDRLGTRLVLTYPSTAHLAVGDRDVVPGPGSPDGLADLGLPVPLPSVGGTEPAAWMMWTSAAKPSAAVSAALGAAGATSLRVTSTDPRRNLVAAKSLMSDADVPVVAVGSGFGPESRLADRVGVVRTAPQIPGGGWVPFPARRMVALYGHPGTPSLGMLGEQGIDASIRRVRSLAAAHARYTSTPVVPAFEIIATVASASHGPDHNFSNESSVASLRPWVDAARKADVYVVLDLQSGRSEFLKQAKLYTALLLQPHVGLALDPEWRLAKGQRPLKQLGSVDIAEVNDVVRWLAALVRVNNLPPKVLTLHQFSTSMIRRRQLLDTSHDEVQVVIHADGQGSRAAKWATWRSLRTGLPRGAWLGWKNFHDEDVSPLSPQGDDDERPPDALVRVLPVGGRAVRPRPPRAQKSRGTNVCSCIGGRTYGISLMSGSSTTSGATSS